MLAIYAYGTNTGIRSVASGRATAHTEEESATSAAAT